MLKYIQVDLQTGVVQGETWLTKKVDYPHMILVADDFDSTNKKYIDGEWVECEPEIEEPEPSTTDPVMEKLESIEAKIQTNTEMEEFYTAVCQEVGLV